MCLIKKLLTFVLFLMSISLSQGAEESKNAANIQPARWPNIEKLQAMDDPELGGWISDLANLEGVIPYAMVQKEVSRFPIFAESAYLETLFESLRLETKPITEKLTEDKIKVKKVIELYKQAFFENYCNRFPEQDRKSFYENMLPFEDYIKSFDVQKFMNMNEEETNDQFERAWTLLKQALKS